MLRCSSKPCQHLRGSEQRSLSCLRNLPPTAMKLSPNLDAARHHTREERTLQRSPLTIQSSVKVWNHTPEVPQYQGNEEVQSCNTAHFPWRGNQNIQWAAGQWFHLFIKQVEDSSSLCFFFFGLFPISCLLINMSRSLFISHYSVCSLFPISHYFQ